MKKIAFLSIAFFIFIGCENQERQVCNYKLSELLQSDSPKVTIVYHDDSLYVVKDVTIGSEYPSGVYTFNEKRNLQSYAFMLNEQDYKFFEEYDSTGRIIHHSGSPLFEYRIWNQSQDTVLFNAYLFSLDKKFEQIEILSNKGDKIEPDYLYETAFYTNVKCFSFKLKCQNDIQNLILVSKIRARKKCDNLETNYYDTVRFNNIKH